MLPLSFQKNNVLSEISVYVRNNLFYQQVMHPYVPLQLPFLPAHKEIAQSIRIYILMLIPSSYQKDLSIIYYFNVAITNIGLLSSSTFSKVWMNFAFRDSSFTSEVLISSISIQLSSLFGISTSIQYFPCER